MAGTTGLGGCGRVTLRLDYLEGQGHRAGRALERGTRVLAVVLALALVTLFASLPSWAMAVANAEHSLTAAGVHCAED